MFVPNIKETQEDNYDTYNNLSDVPLKKAIEDRLYFIRSEKKYYRYDGTLKQLVIAIDLTSINANIQQIAQDVASISSDYATKSYVDEKIVPDDPLSPNFFTLSYPTGASTVPSMSLYSSTESRIDGVVNVNNIQNMRMNNMDTLNNEQNGRLLNIEDANVIQNGRLDTLEANQGGINGRLDSHDSTFVTTINRLSAVEGINSTQTSNISTLEGNVVTLTGNVSTLEGRISAVEGINSTQTSNISTLNGTVSTLSGNVSTLSGTVSTLSGNLANKMDNIYSTAKYSALGKTYYYTLQLYICNWGAGQDGIIDYLNLDNAAVFWTVGDMVHVRFSFRIQSGDTTKASWQNTTDRVRFNLPFKALYEGGNGGSFGTEQMFVPWAQTFYALGGKWGATTVGGGIIENNVNPSNFTILLNPGMDNAGNKNFVTGGYLYGAQGFDLAAAFCYKAKWPLVPVPTYSR